MSPRQGDILLIPVPFTDLSSHKRRPVVVISNSAYNRVSEDVVVVAMTSNPAEVGYSFGISSEDLEAGHLDRPSRVRVDRIYTLSQGIALQLFGRVKGQVLDEIRVRSSLSPRKGRSGSSRQQPRLLPPAPSGKAGRALD